MRDTRRRRLTIISLLFLLVLGGIVSIVIIVRLGLVTTPTDTSAAECTRINFDTLPISNLNTTEDLVISNQYQSLGYTFRTGPRFDGQACLLALPFIAKQGEPFRSFGNNTLNQPDTPAVGETFGPSWLTNQIVDGPGDTSMRPCSLEIIFDPNRRSNAFSFDILDLDYGERWVIEAYANTTDTTPVISQNATAANNSSGDGKAYRVAMTSPTPIAMIKIRPAIPQKADGGAWGLGFDNFSAYCVNDPDPVCGDGILAANRGEVCDDGNIANGDGCSATCQLETINPAQCFNLVNVVVPVSSSTTTFPSSSAVSSIASSTAISSAASSSQVSSAASSTSTTTTVSSATSSLPPLACTSLIQTSPTAASSYPRGTVFNYTATFSNCSGLDNNLALAVVRTSNPTVAVGSPQIGLPVSTNYNSTTRTCTYNFTWTSTADLTAGSYSVYLLADSTAASVILSPAACSRTLNLTVPASSSSVSSTTSIPVSSAASSSRVSSAASSTPVSSATSSVVSSSSSSAISSAVSSTSVASSTTTSVSSATSTAVTAACLSLTQTAPAVSNSYPPGTSFSYTAVFSCSGLDPNITFAVVRAGTNVPVGTPAPAAPTTSNYNQAANTCTYTFNWSATGIVSSGSYIVYLIGHGVTTSSNINL